MIRAAVLLAATMLVAPALALEVPTPDNSSEPRIRHAEYAPSDIIQLLVPKDGQTQVMLRPNDTKISVSIVSKLWRTDTSGHSFVLAPSPGAPITNAVVVEDLPDGTINHYSFLLIPSQEGIDPAKSPVATVSTGAPPPKGEPYAVVRITYAAEDQADALAAAKAKKEAAAAAWRARHVAWLAHRKQQIEERVVAAAKPRCDFLWRGSAALMPAAACDTGAVTKFLWLGQQPVPAVFLVAADGTEQSVTQAPDPGRPGLIIVPTTSRFWRLRLGKKLVLDLYDAAWNPIGQDAGAGAVIGATR